MPNIGCRPNAITTGFYFVVFSGLVQTHFKEKSDFSDFYGLDNAANVGLVGFTAPLTSPRSVHSEVTEYSSVDGGCLTRKIQPGDELISVMKDRLAELAAAVSVLSCFHLDTLKVTHISSLQSRTQAEEDVAVTVDRDGFMESFFRKVGITSGMWPGFQCPVKKNNPTRFD